MEHVQNERLWKENTIIIGENSFHHSHKPSLCEWMRIAKASEIKREGEKTHFEHIIEDGKIMDNKTKRKQKISGVKMKKMRAWLQMK